MKDLITKVRGYLTEVWGEVKPAEGKVSWPTADDVRGSTIVVIVTVAILGVYLAAIDLTFGWLIAKLFTAGN